MQDEHERYDNLLTKINENFSKMVEKIYTRENVSINQEVKETYFSPNNKMKSTNATFELSQIFTDIEKLVVYVEKEKQSLLSKKETTMEHEDIGPKAESLTEKELETMSKLLKARIGEQDEYIKEMKSLVNNLNSLTTIYQL